MAENTNNGVTRFGDEWFTQDQINQKREQSLQLNRIDKDSTIDAMIETIDSNFREIAEHGGGPAGYNGIDGMAGLDGTNVEYIYALSDEMEEGTHFPAGNPEKAALFQNVDNSATGKYPYKNLDWYDHAQPISKEHKNEYVMARNRRSESSSWYYSDPVLWAHWGETGMDGDGVEYIFKIYDHELTEDECRAALPSRDDMTREQKAIYNIDDFFPGAGWFVAKNKSKAEKALTKAGIYNSSTFDNLWTRKFDLSLGWTDDPTGTGLGKPYEYVAIRRSNVEEDTDKKEWSDYSIPALWSKYSFEGRIFIIYRNMPADQKPSVEAGTAPKKGDGWWDNKNGNDKLIFNPASNTGAGSIPEGWTDNNLDHDEGELSWMCSGIFEHTGKNLSWSNPTCISGKDGENGKDGTNIEFIYALSDRMRPGVNYPTTERSDDSNDHNTMEWLFNAVERDKHKIYNDTTEWFDRAQPISPVDRTEYIWSRRRNSENEPWDYDQTPILWAHWGEDGTDGDGIEYIFHVSTDESCPTPIRQNQMTGTWGKYQKLFFQLNDFYPGIGWFTKKNKAGRFVNYEKARAAVEAAIERGESGFDINTFEEEWYDGSENYHGSYFGFNQEWTDNPRGVSAETPYEFVSIRRTISDEDAEVTVWDDFSEPVQWSYYGKRTRHFMVYCYVDEGVTPDSPTGGWWNVSTDSLQMAENDTSDFTCAAVDSAHMPENPVAGTYLWMDDDNEVRGKIAWSADGTFIENSHTPKWSKPHRLTGEKGEKGEDGLNVEFIYARDDNPVWPGDGNETFADETAKKAAMKTLFDAVEENGQSTYIVPGDSDKSTIWHDRALEISRNDRIVYCWSRRRDNETSEWEYDDAPFIWAHWGEDGTDGDGIEYIFHISQVNTLSSGSQEKPVKAVTDIQKIIYNFSDFYPGDRWFNNPDNKADVITALSQHDPNLYNPETFETDWANHFGFNKGSNSWTDNPTDVSVSDPYEFVCIRKSYTDNDGTKKWGEFSEPALWGCYGKSTRSFIIYCNMLEDDGEPTEPSTGTGWYNSTGNGSLVMHEQDDPSTPDDETGLPFKVDALTTTQRSNLNNNPEKDIIGWWSDTDEDTQLTHTITWISTGTFSESGENLSWSKPHRITGEKGQKGADGSNIEFIYTLSDEMNVGTNYPAPGNLSINWKKLFDLVEKPELADTDASYHTIGLDVVQVDGVTCIKYGDTYWYDRARVINNTNRIEWAWSRRLPAGESEERWVYDDAPFVWAHWGEDGTDGDGIEYIFYRLTQPMTITEQQWNTHMVMPGEVGSDYRKVAETIYSMDDFIPNSAWFDKTVNGVQINKKRVSDEMTANNELPQLFDTYWTNAKNHFSFNNIDLDSNLEGVQSLGDWTDNPLQLDAVNSYQYVSIRKSPDGVWGMFSYPTLWSKYNISKYTEFAFVATTIDVDLSSYKPKGGSYETPLPDHTYKKDTNNEYTIEVSGIVWGESPNPDGVKTEIWMTCAKVTEGNPTPLDWSFPRRMTDTNEFQVEWSETMLTLEQVNDLNEHMAQNPNDFNFGKILAEQGVNYNHNTAEGKWRERVFNYTHNSAIYTDDVEFGDESSNSVLMATCQMKNGVWKDWVVKRVKGEKGEKGDPGRSISVKDRINYEVYLDEKDENDNPITYNYSNAYDALDAAKNSLDPAPSTGNLLIVYPHNPTINPNSETGIYIGDTTSDDKGGCLYMWKFDGSDWQDYNTPKNPGVTEGNGEVEGNSYVSPNKHLILWDGDTWQDIGELEGPEGKQWILVVKYGKDKEGSVNQKEFTLNQNDPTDAKYIGTFTYLQGTNVTEYLGLPNFTATGDQLKVMSGWHWATFKGQDGYGFEYIFKATSSLNERPDVPDYTNNNGYTTPNYVPDGYGIHNSSVLVEGWEDEPIEPNSTNKRYIWMCWRKYDYTDQRWSDFMGVDNLKYNTGGKARLWQMYANSVSEVSEFYHVFNTFSPNFSGDNSTSTQIDNTYWKQKSDVIGDWGESNKYLFNREVVTYSDGTTTVLDPHLVATYDNGCIDVVDYYCLEIKNEQNPDPGEQEPSMVKLRDLLGGNRKMSKFRNSGNPITNTTEIPIIDDIDIYKDDNGTQLFGTGYFTNKIAGKDYWVTNPPKMIEEYPVLWNVTMKLYNDGRWDWTTPIVIGVFGEGQQGADSIYADLDNEMDSIQVDTDRNALVERTVSTNVRMYAGENTTLKITDLDISGESTLQSLGIIITRKYYTVNGNNATEYNSLPAGGADYINVSFTIPVNCNLPSDSTKIEMIVYCGEIARRVSYHLVCTTHPTVYDIIPGTTEVLCKNTGTAENPQYTSFTPSSITITVVERTGSVKQEYIKYDSTQKFKLYYKLNNGTETQMTSTTEFSVPTSGRKPGDYYTFRVCVDANNNPSDGYETTLDKETVFFINQGKDGAAGDPGSNGNGYQYCYVRYDSRSQSASSYPTSVCSILEGDRTMVSPYVHFGTGPSISTYTEPKGVDASFTYEFRLERSGYGPNNSSTWGPWSDPVTIAKYLDAGNIETTVDDLIEQKKSSIENDILNSLSDTTSAVEKFSTLIDPSTGQFTGLFTSQLETGILTAYTKDDEITGAVTTAINGIVTSATSVSTFATWMNQTTGSIQNVESTLANMGDVAQLTNRVTALEGDTNDLTGAVNTLKTNVKEKFAEIDNTVYNAQFVTDTDGNLLIDKPTYTAWFNSIDLWEGDSDVNDGTKTIPWTLFYAVSDNNTEYNSVGPNVSDQFMSINNDEQVVIMYRVLVNNTAAAVSAILGSGFNTIFKANMKVDYNKESGEVQFTPKASPTDSKFNYVNQNLSPDGTQLVFCAWATANCSGDGPFTYDYNSLTWDVAIVDQSSSTTAPTDWTYDFAYTKTGSILEKPLLMTSAGYKDVIDHLKLYENFGYSITKYDYTNKVETANNIYRVPVNGDLSVNSDMHLIPGDTPIATVMNYLKNPSTMSSLPTTDTLLNLNENKTYYVGCGYTSPEDINFTYTASLPGDNRNTVTFEVEPWFTNQHTKPSGTNNGFNDVADTDYRKYNQAPTASATTIYDGAYTMPISSPYDVIKFHVNCTLTKNTDYTWANANFKLYVQYRYATSGSGSTWINVLVWDGSKSYTGIFGSESNPWIKTIFGNSLDSENRYINGIKQTIYFRVYATFTAGTLSNINTRYSFTTENKISDYINSNNTSKLSVMGYDLGSIDDIGEENNGTFIFPEAGQSDKLIFDFNDQGYEYVFTAFNVVSDYSNMASSIKISYSEEFDNAGDMYYIVVAKRFTPDHFEEIANNVVNANDYPCESFFFNEGPSGLFLNNETYGTEGITSWTALNNDTISVNFNNSELYNSKYYVTVVLCCKSQILTDFQICIENSTINWTTVNNSRLSTSLSKFMLDKITVHIGDRSRIEYLINSRQTASDKYGNPVSRYIDVREQDKPYLITTVSELASLTQTVGDGIASTAIVVGVGENHAAQVFQATEDGTAIALMADEVNIKSSYLNLDKTGLSITGDIFANSLATNNGNTRITEDGVLYAKNAIIEGTIKANEFEAETTTSIIAPAYANGTILPSTIRYTGDISKVTSIAGDIFNISANGTLTLTYPSSAASVVASANIKTEYDTSLNKIYIELIDCVKTDASSAFNGEALYCVPTLCMMYQGRKYRLNPATWYSNSNSNMKYVYQYMATKYTFNVSNVTNARAKSGSLPSSVGSGTYYIFRTDERYNILSSFETDNVYQFTVLDWGTEGNTVDTTKQTMLTQKGLLNPAKQTLESLLGRDGMQYTGNNTDFEISENNANTLVQYLPNSDKYISKEISQGYPANGNTSPSGDTAYGRSALFNFIKNILTYYHDGEGDHSYYIWDTQYYGTGSGTNRCRITNLDGNLPFDTSGVLAPVRGDECTMYFECYPYYKIASGGTASTTSNVNQILVKCQMNVQSLFTDPYNQTYSLYGYVRQGDVDTTQFSFIPQRMYFNLSFYVIIALSSAISYNPLSDASRTIIVNKVKSFFENFNFSTLLGNEYYKYVTLSGYISNSSNVIVRIHDDY